MRRAVTSSLLLSVLVTLTIVCPCPPDEAAPMADDHACCGKQGFRAAAACCLTAADAPKPAALDAPPVAPQPLAVVVGLAPVVVPRRAPAALRSPLVAPSPPSVLRI